MIGLTKKEEKLIVSLQQKKYRKQESLFVVEGVKVVEEALNSGFNVRFVASSIEFESKKVELKSCDDRVMQRISAFKTPPGILAVVEIPEEVKAVDSPITLLAEKIQDPGNLGTIIRTADALGVKTMICSPDCVDHFSSKVVQASMGSIFRMQIVRTDLVEYINGIPKSTSIYAAHLKGENLYEKKLIAPAILVVGNESQGISEDLMDMVSDPIKIPMQGEVESFNVSIATAIILGEFSRQMS
ncbi:MAG: RNA methyltransferase [Flavobacteriales bacterium]|nr:RNA methyltransferase [Flavobacteriales bacterium]